jgi:hypothetical protein
VSVRTFVSSIASSLAGGESLNVRNVAAVFHVSMANRYLFCYAVPGRLSICCIPLSCRTHFGVIAIQRNEYDIAPRPIF